MSTNNEGDEWGFDRGSLDPSTRKDGISAFMRLRDEEEFVASAITSHLPFYDEIIAVYNRCTDSTPEILHKLQDLYPDKVKVFHYEPHVYPQGSKEHKVLPPDSIHSLVHYCNYALSKTTRKIAVKLDGDMIAIPEVFEQVVVKIRNEGLSNYFGFNGINLLRDAQGRVGVLHDRPLCGGGDIGFFHVSPETYFAHDPRFEVFRNNLPHKLAGILFYHCKFLKRCGGWGNCDLHENPDSRYHAQKQWGSEHTATIPLADFLSSKGLDWVNPSIIDTMIP
jgi:glycosyltransferase involved in cell wall biosynthesis